MFTGLKSKGWPSSSLRSTLKTAGILADHGCTFYCGLDNHDSHIVGQLEAAK